MSLLQEYLKDLEEVVNVDCGSASTEGVTKVARIMQRHYDEMGFHTELVDFGPEAGKGLFATNKPGAEHFDLMLNAHLDTVFPDGTVAKRPFRIEGDRVRGPGCGDCKAGVIAILHALKNARPEDLDRLAIAVCHNPDEEISSIYSRARSRRLFSKLAAPTANSSARERGARSGPSLSTAFPRMPATTRRTAARPFSPPPALRSR